MVVSIEPMLYENNDSGEVHVVTLNLEENPNEHYN